MALTRSQVGVEEQMVKNGDVQEMWLQTTSTVSAICTEGVPVQESLWKLTPRPPLPLASITILTKSRGLAMSAILFLLYLM